MISSTDSAASCTLSIIVPFFNEERTIEALITKLQAAVPNAQIIYISDGSTDASLALVRSRVRSQDCVITKKNGGKGSAVRMGLKHATGEYTVIQDADLEYDPADIAKLCAFAKENHVDAVIGSRVLQKQERAFDTWWYYAGGVFCTWFYNLLYRQRLTDMHSCYKLVRTKLLQSLPLQQNGFGLDTEIVVRLTLRGDSIQECGISYNPRSREEGKSIQWWDGIHCLWLLLSMRVASFLVFGASR